MDRLTAGIMASIASRGQATRDQGPELGLYTAGDTNLSSTLVAKQTVALKGTSRSFGDFAIGGPVVSERGRRGRRASSGAVEMEQPVVLVIDSRWRKSSPSELLSDRAGCLSAGLGLAWVARVRVMSELRVSGLLTVFLSLSLSRNGASANPDSEGRRKHGHCSEVHQ
ncbi:hypothetical protein BV20DRAFT_168563 [Pilatotrama ljubarskyi]|nr:hypothetical protein BV20DRAFT_168563 [Pilatotrama ljubarskyi]